MALFTSKADANLPLLTQFYQLEVPVFEEPEPHIVGVAVLEMSPDLYTWAEGLRGGALVSGWPGRDSAEDLAEWGYLATVHAVFKMFMDCRVDGTIPPPEHVEALNKWFEVVLAPPRISWDDVGFDFEFPGVDGLTLVIHRPLAVEALTVFRDNALGRCEECSSVFVRQKSGQKYCSHRCRVRVSGRKLYAERMEGYPRRYKQRIGKV